MKMVWKKTKHGVDIPQTYGMKESSNDTLWIVAAHRSRAQVFEEVNNELKLINEMKYPEGKMKGREMVSDHPGRSFNAFTRAKGGHQTGSPRHALSNEEDPKAHVASVVSKSIAQWIEAGRNQNRFTQLVLVAEPHLLGNLNSHLTRSTQKRIQARWEKDFAWLSKPELKRRLRRLLPNPGATKEARIMPRPLGAFQVHGD